MAVTIILPPAEILSATVGDLRSAAQGDAKRLVALNKAEYDLVVLRPQIVRVQHAYLVPSTSRAGLVHRVDDVVGCDCEAGRHGRTCRHALALEIIEQARTRTMPVLTPVIAPSVSDAEYARICAEMDELFAK